MTWLDKLLGPRVFVAGVEVSPRAAVWDFLTGAAIAYNPATKRLELTLSGGGGGSLPASGAAGNVLTSDGAGNWVSASADAYDISAFAATTATLEIGATATAPAFTAAHNHTPTTLVLTNNDNGESKNVVAGPTNFTSSQNYTKTANNASVTFTLTGSDGITGDTRTATIAWRPRVYHGIGAAGLTTEAHIEALATSNLQSSRATSYTDNATGANKLYFACPTSYGTPTFTVGGFAGGFTLVSSTISVTNANGVSQNYSLYESDTAGLGSTAVVVS